MTILWWHWLALGLVLAALEMAAAGGFFIIFFGIGAAAVGLLSLAGMAGPLWLQFLLFSAISLATVALFRARVLRWMQRDPQAPAIDTLVGEYAAAAQTLLPGAIGKVELRGASWPAQNVSDESIASGDRVRVVSVDGLMVHVRPEGVR